MYCVRKEDERSKKNMNKLTIEQIIEECNNICAGYEAASMTNGEPIENQREYMKHYQVAEYLIELREYRDTGLTPEKLREIDRLYAEKCKEVAEYERDIADVVNKVVYAVNHCSEDYCEDCYLALENDCRLGHISKDCYSE